jgi:hypothetical protein
MRQPRDGFRKPIESSEVSKVIEEGRRVYIGNLPYEVSLDQPFPFVVLEFWGRDLAAVV